MAAGPEATRSQTSTVPDAAVAPWMEIAPFESIDSLADPTEVNELDATYVPGEPAGNIADREFYRLGPGYMRVPPPRKKRRIRVSTTEECQKLLPVQKPIGTSCVPRGAPYQWSYNRIVCKMTSRRRNFARGPRGPDDEMPYSVYTESGGTPRATFA